MNYNPNSLESIISYAQELKDNTLREACGPELQENYYSSKSKGNFGQLLELFYFGYQPNSVAEPDFIEVGMELKSTPLKTLKNGEFRSKERLVMNIIDYMSVHKEEFSQSSFWKKNKHLLLVFYLHEAEKEVVDYIIKLVSDWEYPDEDLKIIKHDWNVIQTKIKNGLAHEISEGDTFYLGACTKGSTAEKSYRQQPFNEEKAKQRAFSLKQGYVNHIIASISSNEKETYGKIITTPDLITDDKTIEELILEKFTPFYNKTSIEIEQILRLNLNSKAKSFFASLSKTILGIGLGDGIEEFRKADIEFKTIRIEENNSIQQSISFPAFKFENIYSQSWIDSDLKEITERKFLFVFFKQKEGSYYLSKAMFWNMPFQDRKEVRKVWLKTKRLIQNGSIFKDYSRDKEGKIKLSIKGNPIRMNNLPKIKDSKVCHVRPHGTDSTHTYPLPVQDRKLKSMEYSKQCFWLNANYVRDEIYLK